MIAPIQTWYKNYHMRSRLEARWSVFFDALGLAWRYEVEGFDLGAAGYYLPDFWLPELRLWCEVKGAEPPAGDLRKLQALAEGQGSNVLLLVGDPGAPEPKAEYYDWPYSARLFIGDFPAVAPLTAHHYLGGDRLESLAAFLQEKVEDGLLTGPAPAFDGSQARLQILRDLDRQYYRAKYGREHPSWEYGYTLSELRWCERQPGQWSLSWADGTAFAEHTTPALQAAYQAARAARFEHGAQPITSAPSPSQFPTQKKTGLATVQSLNHRTFDPPSPGNEREALALHPAATHTIAGLCAAPADQVGVIAGRLSAIRRLLPAEQQGSVVWGMLSDGSGMARLKVPTAVYEPTAPLWTPGQRVLITGRLASQTGDYAGVVLLDGRTLLHTILEVQTVQELPT